MRTLATIILVLLIAFGIVGYFEGWFTVTNTDGKTNLQFDRDKFSADRDAFGKTVSEKTHELSNSIAGLWKKSEKLKGDEKEHVQAELKDLEVERDKLEKQIKDLGAAAQPKFESIKQDLSTRLADVEKKIADLNKKLG